MKVIKTLGSVILIMALMLSFSAGAFADNWDLANGQVIVSCDESGVQQVTQNAPPVADANPVITGQFYGTPVEGIADCAVYLDTTNGDINVTFDNVTINDGYISAGTVPNEEATLNDVTMTFTGDNEVSSVHDGGPAIDIHDVSDVTIKGDDETALLSVEDCNRGLSVTNAESLTIDNMDINIEDAETIGLTAFYVDDVNIENSNINVGESGRGISISYAEDVDIDNSNLNIDTDYSSFQVHFTDDLTVNNSSISVECDCEGVNLGGIENATFNNCSIDTNSGYGFSEFSVNNTTFNNSSVDVNGRDVGMYLYNVENAIFANSNLNVNSDLEGLSLEEVDNLNINGSDFSVSAKEIAVVLYGDSEPNLQISGSTMITPKTLKVITLDESVFTLADENGDPVKEVKVERNPAPAAVLTADAEGKSVGESFSFACAESDVQSVSCGGVTLTKGSDYTVSTSGGLVRITFTDTFFAVHGNGPHYVTINIGGVLYNLTVVRN